MIANMYVCTSHATVIGGSSPDEAGARVFGLSKAQRLDE